MSFEDDRNGPFLQKTAVNESCLSCSAMRLHGNSNGKPMRPGNANFTMLELCGSVQNKSALEAGLNFNLSFFVLFDCTASVLLDLVKLAFCQTF